MGEAFDGIEYYTLGTGYDGEKKGQAIALDVMPPPGTVDPASVTAWDASVTRLGDAFVGITYLPTNTHYFYPSFTVVRRPATATRPRADIIYVNGEGDQLNKRMLTEIYGTHYITVDRNAPGALAQRSGIQHVTAAARAGFGGQPGYWIGWSILGTKNPASPQEIRFVSGRNVSRFRDRRASFDGQDPRDLPAHWREWVTSDLTAALELRRRRQSMGFGHHDMPRRIQVTGEVRVGWTTGKCNMRDNLFHRVVADLPKKHKVLVHDVTEGSTFGLGFFSRAKQHWWVSAEIGGRTQLGWVRRSAIKITTKKPD